MKYAALGLLAVAAASSAADEWKLPDEKIVFKDAPGSELAKANCIMCHSNEYITTQPRLTRDQWKASVAKMQQKYGAAIPADMMDALLDYLEHAYGKAAK